MPPANPDPVYANYNLLTLWGSGPNDVYAGAPIIHRGSDGVWKPEPMTSLDPQLRRIGGSGPDDVYAVAIPESNQLTGQLYRHTAAGQWSLLATLPEPLESLYVPSPGNLWIGTRTRGLIHSPDGGATFTAVAATDGYWIGDITAAGATMIAVGSRTVEIPNSNPPMFKTTGALFRSLDAGATWSATVSDTVCARAKIANGVLWMKCASDHPLLLRSTDFGDTSTDRLPPEPPTVPFLPADLWVGGSDDVWFPDENASRGVFHSSDAGLTWENFDFGGSTTFYSVCGSGPRDVYVAGQRNTTNGPVYLMMHGHD